MLFLVHVLYSKMHEANQAGHIPVIGALRGGAALAVALFHIVNTPTGFETNQLVREIFVKGAHGVQVFFVISGLVIPLSLMRKDFVARDFGRFMLKRSIRLEPTYLMVILVGLLWIPMRAWLTGGDAVEYPEWPELLLNVTYLAPFVGVEWINPVFWTLGIELQFYLLCALLFSIRFNQKLVGILWVYPLVSVILKPVASDMFLTSWLDFFMVGGLLALFFQGRLSESMLGGLLIACFVTAIWNHGYFLASILIVTALIILFLSGQSGGRFFQFIGYQSYSLYLIHPLVGTTFVNGAMRYLDWSAPLIHWTIVLAATGLSVAMAQILYKAVELPTLNYSKSVALKSDKS